MNNWQRISKNIVISFAGRIGGYLLSFFSLTIMARHLGPANFGIITFALAFTGIFASIFTRFGLEAVTTREVSRERRLASKYFANVSLMKLVQAIITFALIAIAVNLIGYSQDTVRIVYLIGLSVILSAVIGMFYSFFEAFERMTYFAVSRVIEAALLFSGVVIATVYDSGLAVFALVFVAARTAILIYNYFALKYFFPRRESHSIVTFFEFDREFWKATLRKALPFALTVTFVSIFYWVDTVILAIYREDNEVGLYNAAYRLVFAFSVIPIAFNAAFYPAMSRCYVTSPGLFRAYYERFLKYMIMFALPVGVGATLLADRLIHLVFGPEYAGAVIALRILIWSMVFIYISSPMSRVLESSDNQSVITKIAGVCVTLNILLNFALIPSYGFVAAGATTVATEFISLVLHCTCMFRLGYPLFNIIFSVNIIKILIGNSLMAMFILYFHDGNIFVLSLSASLLYFTSLYILGGIDHDDINFVRGVVDK